MAALGRRYEGSIGDDFVRTVCTDILGSSANIRKSNIPCALASRLINLYYSGHTWYTLPSSTCCLFPQRLHLITGWQLSFQQHPDLLQNVSIPDDSEPSFRKHRVLPHISVLFIKYSKLCGKILVDNLT